MNRKCFVICNGWFSFCWLQIFDMGGILFEMMVLKVCLVEVGWQVVYVLVLIDEVVVVINEYKFDFVFVLYVEIVFGMMLFDVYLCVVVDVVYVVGGMFVLDCIVLGIVWVDMQVSGVDILISVL